MKKYTLMEDGSYRNNKTGYSGIRPGHWMYEGVEKWLAEGNTPDPQYTEQELEDRSWAILRSDRDKLLSDTDFMMTYDFYTNKMTSQEQTDVSTYRESLRNLPANTPDPENPTWPTKPQIVIDNGI